MSARILACMAVSAFWVSGCTSTGPKDIQTALDAVGAAHEAARTSLPDTPLARGVMDVLDVAVSTYTEIAQSDQDESPDWARYSRWVELAARAVSAVISILDGAGIDIPDIILEANRTLQRWLL